MPTIKPSFCVFVASHRIAQKDLLFITSKNQNGKEKGKSCDGFSLFWRAKFEFSIGNTWVQIQAGWNVLHPRPLLEILILNYFIGNTLLEILYWKYIIGNTLLEILYWKYLIGNTFKYKFNLVGTLCIQKRPLLDSGAAVDKRLESFSCTFQTDPSKGVRFFLQKLVAYKSYW